MPSVCEAAARVFEFSEAVKLRLSVIENRIGVVSEVCSPSGLVVVWSTRKEMARGHVYDDL